VHNQTYFDSQTCTFAWRWVIEARSKSSRGCVVSCLLKLCPLLISARRLADVGPMKHNRKLHKFEWFWSYRPSLAKFMDQTSLSQSQTRPSRLDCILIAELCPLVISTYEARSKTARAKDDFGQIFLEKCSWDLGGGVLFNPLNSAIQMRCIPDARPAVSEMCMDAQNAWALHTMKYSRCIVQVSYTT
jgi:hypothetical protein